MIFDRYLFRQTAGAFTLVALTLSAIIMLTQSLRFLELVIDSGASSAAFWLLSFLALPRLFEIIVPVALMMSVVFVYNRLSGDNEMTVMRVAGFSSLRLSRPAVLLASGLTLGLIVNAFWLSPAALTSLHVLRQTIKAEISTLLLREGVFNEIGEDLTVYLEKRGDNGAMEGLVIYDSRPELPAPVTIIARRGQMVATDTGQQVIVYDGSRQDINPRTRALNRLDFTQYSVDFPESSAVSTRWREPEERTMTELLNPDAQTRNDPKGAYKFMVEAHRRLAGPFLPLTFVFVSLACLLVGHIDRRGQGRRILLAVAATVLIEGGYMGVMGLASSHPWTISLLYVLVFLPMLVGYVALNHEGDGLRLWRYLLARESEVAA